MTSRNRKKWHKPVAADVAKECCETIKISTSRLRQCDMKRQAKQSSRSIAPRECLQAFDRTSVKNRTLSWFSSEFRSQTYFRLFLALISLMIYSNSLNCGFVYDDKRAILENRNVQLADGSNSNELSSLSNLKQLLWRVFLVDDFWGTPLSHSGSHKSYRPLTTLSFKFQFSLQHLLENYFHPNETHHSDRSTQSKRFERAALLSHLVNLILHLLVCDLVFQFANVHFSSLMGARRSDKKSLQRPWQSAAKSKSKLHYNNEGERGGSGSRGREDRARGDSTQDLNATLPEVGDNKNVTTLHKEAGEANSLEPFACIAAVLFACHPIHVEAVTSLVGRAELMATLFAMLSLHNMIEYLFVRTRAQLLVESNNQANNKRDDVVRCGVYSLGPLAKSGFWAALALLSKENSSVMMVVVNLLIAIWLLSTRTSTSIGSKCKRAIGVMLSLLVLYSVHRIALNGAELLPRFSPLDNPLAQSERQFCLTTTTATNSDPETIQQEQMKLCSDEQHLATIRNSLLITRLYLPAFALSLLVNPTELSYDWPLSSIGLVRNLFEFRALFACAVYSLALSILIRWSIEHLKFAFAKSSKKIKTSVGLDESEETVEVDETTNSNDDEELSETSSVRSLDTLKSGDSGFADVTPRPQTPADNSPSSNGSENSQVFDDSDKENLRTGLAEFSRALAQRIDKSAKTRNQWRGAKHETNGRYHQRTDLGLKEPTNELQDSMANHNRLAWSLLLLILSHLPGSNLLVPVGFLVAERTLYLPSVGFCLLASHLIEHLAHRIVSLVKADHKLGADSGETQRKRQSRSCASSKDRPAKKLSARLLVFAPQTTLETTPKTDKNDHGKLLQRRRVYDCAQNIGRLDAIRLMLVLPLLVMGSLKSVQRNLDWRDEFSLFSSNIEQSPAKSMANLASLQLMAANDGASRTSGPAPSQRVEMLKLYKRALELEPNSADLHYNFALALHQQSLKFEPSTADGALSRSAQLGEWSREHQLDQLSESGAHQTRHHVRHVVELQQHSTPNNDWRRPGDLVEYHYKMALQLRGGNFPLAALNLAAWQSNELNQLAKAEWNLIENCAKQMAPERAKNYNQHVRTQIECLISGCRLVLGDFNAATSVTTGAKGADGAMGTTEQADFGDEQTTAAAHKQSGTMKGAMRTTMSDVGPNHHHHRRPQSPIASNDGKCLKVSSWLKLARQKFEQIDGTNQLNDDDATFGAHKGGVSMSMSLSGLDHFGDSRKQLATIYWLESRCASGRDGADKKKPISLAFKLALESSSPIEWDLYLDYANSLDGDNTKRLGAIERAARREIQKRVGKTNGKQLDVSDILIRSARRLAANNKRQLALNLVKRAINLDVTPNASHLTLAGQLSLDLGSNAESETHYRRALDELLRLAIETRLVCRHGGLATGAPNTNGRLIANKSSSSFALRRQLGSAHANYGAILQVNGHPSELIRSQYRRALECDPDNLVAARNLKRMR